MKRTTIFLPDELHEQLRGEAFRERVSMAQLIRVRLERPAGGKKAFRRLLDPLERVEGIIQHGGLSARIDEELYGN
jgi:hypothetical protein